jgi:DNA-directed RNA polymerase specialized sigma24 family protein
MNCMTVTEMTELRQDGRRTGAEDVTPDHTDHRNGSDEVLHALDELESVLRENAESERLLSRRIADVRRARQNGQEWKAILGDEDDPGTVQLVSTILRRQSEASGYLRRSLVVALRGEGQSIPSIAHLFGVTHQRVSNLLRRVAQGAAGNSEKL